MAVAVVAVVRTTVAARDLAAVLAAIVSAAKCIGVGATHIRGRVVGIARHSAVRRCRFYPYRECQRPLASSVVLPVSLPASPLRIVTAPVTAATVAAA